MPETDKQNSTETKNSFVAMEEEVLDFWDKADIFHQSIEKDSPKGNFVFFEGPPTANGLPGIHHVLARAFKDVLPRYKTMDGYRVERKAGWDTHGLPVELQVEKQLGISGKPDIEKYGIKEFNQKCQESVWTYLEEWKKLTRRIAFWVDMEDAYVTYDNNYIESLWHILKEIDAKGLLYKGHKVVPHCPRCGTALSSHEVAQGYKLVKDNSVYLKFKIKNGYEKVTAGDFILAWTTTPWTLPGNVALAVGENIEYVKVKTGDDFLIIAKERLETVFKDISYQIISELKGADLVGLEYEPLFEITSIKNDASQTNKPVYQVLAADFVTISDGTGVVHTAVMYGEDDYNLGLAAGLPTVHTVSDSGHFTKDLAAYDLEGKFVKSATTEKIILDYLQSAGLLFKEEVYEHDYPFCWRCDTPLLYYAKDSWFIEVSKLKEELIANNEKINWTPDHIKAGRFGEWLNNVKDWAISRERYWGTPLPIWECSSCDRRKVIGSVEELSELSGTKLNLKSELHRPEIDTHEITCSTCGGRMKRVKEVFDCWFDSGAMPYAQHHYPFDNKNLIDKGEQFPADFICEAIDQTRGWFYTLLAVSTLLGKGNPYKNVICLGHINDKTGKKMSKSKGNIINPHEVISQYGVDAVRQHMYTINQPGEGKRYDIEDVKDVFRKNIMLLWNVYKFYEMYASELKADSLKTPSGHVLDRWIIAKLNLLINNVADELDKYHVYEAARQIPEFIDELSTWYLRRSRDRFKSEDETDKQAALATTKYVLEELAKVMAPFMPFISESLWQKISGYNFQAENKSVHLEAWPLKDETDNSILLSEMTLARKVVELGLAKRDEAGIKIRQMLGLAKVTIKKEIPLEYLDLIKDELNIANIEFAETNEEQIVVALDTTITPELKAEGIKRELVRLINNLRKDLSLTITDELHVSIVGASEEIIKVIESRRDELVRDTLCLPLDTVDFIGDGLSSKEVKIDDCRFKLAYKSKS